MQALTQAGTLALWESGRSLHAIDQALLAVQAAFPETREQRVADWPLGRRNRALAQLHCACFGPSLRGWTACRQCGENLEFEIDGNALAQTGAADETDISFENFRFRLPTSRDLAGLAGVSDSASAAAMLLDRCLVAAEAGQLTAAWSENDIEMIGERLAAADPLAEILLDFDCPLCGEIFQEPLDLTAFFWSALEGSCKRLLLDVHALASAYGWSEAEILGLSRARRNFYLEQVRL